MNQIFGEARKRERNTNPRSAAVRPLRGFVDEMIVRAEKLVRLLKIRAYYLQEERFKSDIIIKIGYS